MSSDGSLYVIKLGSSTIVNHPQIFEEINDIVKRGSRVLLVAGGAEAIKQKYESISRPMPFLTLPSGDEVRYCSPEEMPYICEAYHDNILSRISNHLKEYGLSVYAQLGGDHGLVLGEKAKPLKAIRDGKKIIVRDSLFGQFVSSRATFLKAALVNFDVVCVTPPIWDPELNTYINIDADVLAAHLAVDLEAHHLRFVTGTAGLLQDIQNPHSTIPDVYADDELSSVEGRMKQKVRAARLAVQQGACDVNISGPHTLNTGNKTWFWNVESDLGDFDLLNKVVRIPSVSQDEHELAQYLLDSIRYPSVSGNIDEAGNIVFRKGNGPHTLLLLGHIDTVPHVWPVRTDSSGVTGRGVVDAKGCFVNFIHMLEKVDVPEHGSLLVIGAVEEEISSSKGAFYIRDHYVADAVIIGEPSGEESLTLGYYGLFKLHITIHRAQEHTAAKDSVSVIDELYSIAGEIRHRVREVDPQSLSSLIDIEHRNEKGTREKRGDKLIVRAMPVKSIELQISGICDVVEFIKDDHGVEIVGAEGKYIAYPIEYKRGKPKTNESDILQLAAQAICLEEMLLCDIPVGYMFYDEIKHRVEVSLTADLKDRVRSTVKEMQDYYRRRYTPKVKTGPFCQNCSLHHICLPKLMNKRTVKSYMEGKVSE